MLVGTFVHLLGVCDLYTFLQLNKHLTSVIVARGEQRDTGASVSPTTSISCQYHSTCAPCSLILPSLTQCDLIS